jgi:hypothetical protein
MPLRLNEAVLPVMAYLSAYLLFGKILRYVPNAKVYKGNSI